MNMRSKPGRRLLLRGVGAIMVGGLSAWVFPHCLADDQDRVAATVGADTVPQSAGLAAKYPGDVGIERDPAVLFAENFETGTIEEIGKRWDEVSNKDGRVLALDSDVPSDSRGKRSLQMTGTLSENSGGHLYTRFPDVDTAFLRFYVKFPPEYFAYPCGVHLGGYNPPTAWPQGNPGRPRGDEHMMVEIIPTGEYGNYAPPGIWAIAAFWPDMERSADGQYWGNNLTPAQAAPVASDRWQCVEVMLQCNSTPDRSDGELALWLDGQLRMHVKPGVRRGPWSGMGFSLVEQGGELFEGFRWRTNDDLKINFLWLLYNVTTPNPAGPVARVWYDDIVVSTQYVGPIQK
ncbi:MAG: hypothetical protein AB1505_31480 [Candidatus Latescibacterota bacterium]